MHPTQSCTLLTDVPGPRYPSDGTSVLSTDQDTFGLTLTSLCPSRPPSRPRPLLHPPPFSFTEATKLRLKTLSVSKKDL